MIDGNLIVTPRGDREIEMKREFNAPRKMVFDAFTKPELIKRWLLGPDGWTMPVCEVELKVGGRYRYVWRQEDKGIDMGISGTYREIAPPARIVHTEKFDESWYPGEAVITTEFVERGGKTILTMTIVYESREARDTALKSGMEKGVEMSYKRLDAMFTKAA
jgi:uncharacterized protein YndB with AHSA1/START domain